MSARGPTARSPPSTRCATRATSAVRQPELRLEYLMKAALTETDEPSDRRRRPNGHRVAFFEARGRLAVDRQRRRTMTDHLDLDGLFRIEHQRAIEQHVRRHWGQQQSAVLRRDD